MTQLHECSFIHNTGSNGLLKEVIQHLLDSDLLVKYQHGIKHDNKRTPVYIKRLPTEGDPEIEKEFRSLLSEYKYEKNSISLELYKEKCQSLSVVTDGILQDDVYDILNRPEYATCAFFTSILVPDPVETQSLNSNRNGK